MGTGIGLGVEAGIGSGMGAGISSTMGAGDTVQYKPGAPFSWPGSQDVFQNCWRAPGRSLVFKTVVLKNVDLRWKKGLIQYVDLQYVGIVFEK